MRRLKQAAMACAMAALLSASATADQTSPLTATPQAVTMVQLKDASRLDNQLVQLNALVRHSDTAQVFTLGDKQGPEIHVVVPYPATDAAHIGDTVALTGFVRRFDASKFEKEYQWFRSADYKDVKGGDWVIVATSVRTSEGTELVPPMTISNTPPAKTK
ncbi:MAG TPA: hypothetical protein VM115_08435 [Vicinamibacterales bacterium]|nr:hypothetical protein [Vicinamibacterales bacterium]